MRRRTRRSIRDAAFLLTLFLLVATVRITPPPHAQTVQNPPVQASQKVDVELPAVRWNPGAERAAERAVEATHLERAVEPEHAVNRTFFLIRTGSATGPEVRTLRLEVPVLVDGVRAALPADRRSGSS